MEKIKNILVIFASIAVMAFVADKFGTKYNINTAEPTCTNNDVEEFLLEVATKRLKDKAERNGFLLKTRVIKENTVTEKREITYKGKSKYSCTTSIEFELSAVQGNKHTRDIISEIPKENLIVVRHREYSISENDLGTTFFVRSLEIQDTPFELEIIQASNKIEQQKLKIEQQKLNERQLERQEKYDEIRKLRLEREKVTEAKEE